MSKASLNKKSFDFTLNDFSGKKIALSDFLGKNVILIFNRGFF